MAINSVDYTKDPQARLDYRFDWSPWLMEGESIINSAWTVAAGLAYDAEETNPTNTCIWLKAGTVGQSFSVANKVTTTAGRIESRSFVVRIQER